LLDAAGVRQLRGNQERHGLTMCDTVSHDCLFGSVPRPSRYERKALIGRKLRRARGRIGIPLLTPSLWVAIVRVVT